MQQMLNFFQSIVGVWERIKNFDFRELTFTQMFFTVTGVVVALWLLGQVLSFVLGILNILGPLALVMMVLYTGFRWSRSRSEDIPDEAKKSKSERLVDEAMANVQAVSQDENTTEATGTRIDVSTSEEITVKVAEEDNLSIKQVVNPETGFKEPDISRLIENEEAKLKEADKINDDIMAQIEARRKRLKNGGA
ncbi:MAG: hypothetical protein Phog2KO_30410 [Phototrophicaceae bacterium]